MEDAMSERDVDAELSRLKASTEGVKPRADFASRVMGAVRREQPSGFWFELPRVSRVLIPVAAFAAAVGVVWGIANTDLVDSALVNADDDSVEVAW
jgi:hypothetical protein